MVCTFPKFENEHNSDFARESACSFSQIPDWLRIQDRTISLQFDNESNLHSNFINRRLFFIFYFYFFLLSKLIGSQKILHIFNFCIWKWSLLPGVLYKSLRWRLKFFFRRCFFFIFLLDTVARPLTVYNFDLLVKMCECSGLLSLIFFPISFGI